VIQPLAAASDSAAYRLVLFGSEAADPGAGH